MFKLCAATLLSSFATAAPVKSIWKAAAHGLNKTHSVVYLRQSRVGGSTCGGGALVGGCTSGNMPLGADPPRMALILKAFP